MDFKKIGLVIGSILFGGGIGMLTPIRGVTPAIIFIMFGIVIQVISIKEDAPYEIPKQ